MSSWEGYSENLTNHGDGIENHTLTSFPPPQGHREERCPLVARRAHRGALSLCWGVGLLELAGLSNDNEMLAVCHMQTTQR